MFARSALLAFAALPLAAYASSSCAKPYTVKAGDYCDLISASQGVSTYQLIALNTPAVLHDCENLVPGEQLCLASTDAEDCTQTAVVKSGDTCDTLLSAHGVANMTIFELNNPQVGSECDIYVGEVVCVAKTVAAPPLNSAVVSSIMASASATPTTVSSAPFATSTDDGDDGDLPWCDEL